MHSCIKPMHEWDVVMHVQHGFVCYIKHVHERDVMHAQDGFVRIYAV